MGSGKIRLYNEPLMSYLSDKIMLGAVVALDDPYQEEALPHAIQHYGQARERAGTQRTRQCAQAT